MEEQSYLSSSPDHTYSIIRTSLSSIWVVAFVGALFNDSTTSWLQHWRWGQVLNNTCGWCGLLCDHRPLPAAAMLAALHHPRPCSDWSSAVYRAPGHHSVLAINVGLLSAKFLCVISFVLSCYPGCEHIALSQRHSFLLARRFITNILLWCSHHPG